MTGVAPVVVLTKVADPTTRTEPGGDFVFTLTIANNSNASDPITIDSIEKAGRALDLLRW